MNTFLICFVVAVGLAVQEVAAVPVESLNFPNETRKNIDDFFKNIENVTEARIPAIAAKLKKIANYPKISNQTRAELRILAKNVEEIASKIYESHTQVVDELKSAFESTGKKIFAIIDPKNEANISLLTRFMNTINKVIKGKSVENAEKKN